MTYEINEKLNSIGYVCVCVHPTTSYLFTLNQDSKDPLKTLNLKCINNTKHTNTILGSHYVDAVTQTLCAMM